MVLNITTEYAVRRTEKMVLNMTTDYAVRVLSYLSAIGRTASAQELSAKMEIPARDLAAVTKQLKANGVIASAVGSGGGWYLVRSPADISLADVIAWMENGVRVDRCESCGPGCDMYEQHDACPISNAYEPVKAAIGTALARITIQDLANSSVHEVSFDGDFPWHSLH